MWLSFSSLLLILLFSKSLCVILEVIDRLLQPMCCFIWHQKHIIINQKIVNDQLLVMRWLVIRWLVINSEDKQLERILWIMLTSLLTMPWIYAFRLELIHKPKLKDTIKCIQDGIELKAQRVWSGIKHF